MRTIDSLAANRQMGRFVEVWPHKVVYLLVFLVLASCQSQPTQEQETAPVERATTLEYATTFALAPTDDGTLLSILQPWNGNTQAMHYLLYPRAETAPQLPDSVQGVPVPIERLICYSTTHLPYLDMLGSEETLVAYPGTQYITTASIRERVSSGAVRELGSTNAINPEVLLDVAPDVVMMFALDAPGAEYEQLENAQLPVIFNGDYLEEHPLGRAEYVKLFGALLGKEAQADSIFKSIETNFLALSSTVPTEGEKPTVFGGLVYGGTWYAPSGNSWLADFMNRGGGRYMFADQTGAGSLALSFETVFAACLEADYWIGAGSFTTMDELLAAEERYGSFAAVQNGNVYSAMKGADPKGGTPYFELGYARPDLVLADFIEILKPDTNPDSLSFFLPLR